MYLFEAIKLGSMMRPQGFGSDSSNPTSLTLCAFGAARLANGSLYGTSIFVEFPITNTHSECPVCKTKTPYSEIGFIIGICLNDDHKWSREQIAQWLEPIELAYYDAHPEQRPVDVVVEYVNTTQELVYV